jgi:hypothetical protein
VRGEWGTIRAASFKVRMIIGRIRTVRTLPAIVPADLPSIDPFSSITTFSTVIDDDRMSSKQWMGMRGIVNPGQ